MKNPLDTIRAHAESHRALAQSDAYSAQEAPRLEAALAAVEELRAAAADAVERGTDSPIWIRLERALAPFGERPDALAMGTSLHQAIERGGFVVGSPPCEMFAKRPEGSQPISLREAQRRRLAQERIAALPVGTKVRAADPEGYIADTARRLRNRVGVVRRHRDDGAPLVDFAKEGNRKAWTWVPAHTDDVIIVEAAP